VTYRVPYPAVEAEPDEASPRVVSKWFIGFMFSLAFFALLVALQVMQITSEDAAKRTLRRTVAAATEIDVLIERHHEELVTRAESAAPNDPIVLEEFPIGVTLTREETIDSTPDELRALLLDRSADVLYDEGADAWLSEESTSADGGTFSLAGLVERAIGLLREGAHELVSIVLIVLAVISAVLAAALVAASRGFGRLVSLGAAMLVASAAMTLIAVIGWGVLKVSSPSEYIESELIAIGEELAWAPVRNGLAACGLSLVVLAIGIAGARIADARRAH